MMDSMHSGFHSESNRTFSLAAILLFAALSGCSTAEKKLGPVPETKTQYQLEDENGQTLDLKLGQAPSFVSFSSTWCESCKKHRKDFHNLYNKYNGQGMKFYFARVGETAKDVREELKKENAPFGHLFDKDGVVAEKFKIDTTPTVLIYDRKGKEVYRSDVYDEQEIIDSISKVLN